MSMNMINRDSNNVIYTRQEGYHFTKNGKKVKTIKVNGQTIYREYDGEVIRDLRYLYENDVEVIMGSKEISEETFEDIKKDNKVMNLAKKLYGNEQLRSMVKTFGILVIIYSVYSFTPVGAPAVLAAPSAGDIYVFKEMQQVNDFISFVINMIRALAVAICAFIAANTGLKLLTEDTGEPVKEIKKSTGKILWALFLVFVGTSLAKMMAMRLLGGL